MTGGDILSEPMLTKADLLRIFPVHVSTLNRVRRNDPTFPRPVRMGKLPLWRKDQVAAWIETQTAKS